VFRCEWVMSGVKQLPETIAPESRRGTKFSK
jgi:hypothetical protein